LREKSVIHPETKSIWCNPELKNKMFNSLLKEVAKPKELQIRINNFYNRPLQKYIKEQTHMSIQGEMTEI